jgi:hypothetical protein
VSIVSNFLKTPKYGFAKGFHDCTENVVCTEYFTQKICIIQNNLYILEQYSRNHVGIWDEEGESVEGVSLVGRCAHCCQPLIANRKAKLVRATNGNVNMAIGIPNRLTRSEVSSANRLSKKPRV